VPLPSHFIRVSLGNWNMKPRTDSKVSRLRKKFAAATAKKSGSSQGIAK
jgi:hypothetical protein